MTTSTLGGTFTFPGTDMTVRRFGYGAMRLTGPGIWGPPADEDEALAVLRDAIAMGINHIDTADYYGRSIANGLIHKALHPYPGDLVIVSKIGATRGDDKSWIPAMSPDEIKAGVENNLRVLDIEAVDIVNLRLMDDHNPDQPPLDRLLGVMTDLQRQGMIRHIGISTASLEHVRQARNQAEIVCVQNEYNIANRNDDALIDELAEAGIAYVPYFPLGGFSPLQSEGLDKAAKAMDATPMQVALAWLLQRSPNILVIAGTSSRSHLHENAKAAELVLPEDVLADLDALANEPA